MKDKIISVKLKKEMLVKVEPQMKKQGAKFVPLINQLLEDWANKQEFINVLLSDPKIKFSNKTLSGKN